MASSSRRSGVVSSLAVSVAMTASAAGVLLLAWSNGCIDGTTPNCAGDAGCGPGIDAALFDAVVSDGKTAADVHSVADASDAAADASPDGVSDATSDATDAQPDAPASGNDGGDGAVKDATPADSSAKG